MKARLAEEDVIHFAHVFNFLGELKLHPNTAKVRIELAAARRQSALDDLVNQLEIVQYWYPSRNCMVAQITKEDEVHRLIGRAWEYLTYERQIEFNAMIAAQQSLLDDRARKRWERDKAYAEAAKRQPLDDATRMQRLEDRYRNEDAAIQVIGDLTGADAIAAELAAAAEYRIQQNEKQKRDMTQGQITSMSRNAPKKTKRKYTRKS